MRRDRQVGIPLKDFCPSQQWIFKMSFSLAFASGPSLTYGRLAEIQNGMELSEIVLSLKGLFTKH
jgi:hypothetical protein